MEEASRPSPSGGSHLPLARASPTVREVRPVDVPGSSPARPDRLDRARRLVEEARDGQDPHEAGQRLEQAADLLLEELDRRPGDGG